MPIFYLDPVAGSDNTTNTPLGWWGIKYSSGNGTAPIAGELITGSTSNAIAYLTVETVTVGSTWNSGIAFGSMYFYGKSGTFVNETAYGQSGGEFYISGDVPIVAWQTFSGGTTAARIAPGDTIRFPDSNTRATTVTGDFHIGSSFVVLSSPLNVTLNHAVTGWETGLGIAGSSTSTRKYGTRATKFDVSGTFTSGLIGWSTIESGNNFSAYQQVSLLFYTNKALMTPDTLFIALCSDSSGVDIVNDLPIPAISGIGKLFPLVLDNNGPLGSNINSIALYSNTNFGSPSLYVNNVVACNASNTQDCITHRTIIGTSGNIIYPIKWISGAAIAPEDQGIAETIIPFAGASYSGTVWAVEPFINPTKIIGGGATFVHHIINDSGDTGSPITYTGGWSKSTNQQVGYSYFDSLTTQGNGISISTKGFVNFENIGLIRYATPFSLSAYNNGSMTNCYASIATSTAFDCTNVRNNRINELKLIRNVNALVFSTLCMNNYINGITLLNTNNIGLSFSTYAGNNFFINGSSIGNVSYGINFTNGADNNTLENITTSGNNGGIALGNAVNVYLRNCTIYDTNELAATISPTYGNGRIFSMNHDNTAGNHKIFYEGGDITYQTGSVHGTEPGAWKMTTSNTTRKQNSPLPLKIAEVAVVPGTPVTITAWVAKSHATNQGARIVVYPDSTYGVSTEQSATKADDTDWQNLSISFTPSVSGVIPVYAETWYINNYANTFIGAITVTQ